MGSLSATAGGLAIGLWLSEGPSYQIWTRCWNHGCNSHWCEVTCTLEPRPLQTFPGSGQQGSLTWAKPGVEVRDPCSGARRNLGQGAT